MKGVFYGKMGGAEEPWGYELQANLYDCSERVTNGDEIKNFAQRLCEVIEMRAYGDPIAVHFGDDPRVSGFSLVQLIETSLISGHFVDDTKRAYINVFSCKKFDVDKALAFMVDYFDAKGVDFKHTER